MLALYLAAFGFGTTMILVSLLLGGGDKDFDKDLHVDKDLNLDKDLDHGPLDKVGHESSTDKVGSFSAWWLLSLRFWTFGLATFGLTGLLLSFMPVPEMLTAVVATSTGLGLGFGAARLFRALNRDEVSGDTEFGRFAGEEARVMVAIRPGAPGKIAINSMSGRVEMLATTRDPDPIDAGSTVIVAAVSGGIADVSRIPVLDDESRRRKAKAAAQSAGSRERNEV
jgi:hypothetical protein